MNQRSLSLIATALTYFSLFLVSPASAVAEPPEVGSKAPDFTLSTPDGRAITLSELTPKGRVVLVLLRGFPHYQCPYCHKQVYDFQLHADKFAALETQVLFVYPGPPAKVDKKAEEFLTKQDKLSGNLYLVVDPDYKFTNQYGLRWEGLFETAYPSTFIIDRNRTILFRKISHSHGDRSTSEEVLAELTKSESPH
ncbi:peroxiredoxin family protein [Edaphobacter bradus]|uniref:peroxiredoxin family protein n=1 Tax=Edaphobacter bradus TaxID=2259016 RepID=UPI0021DFCCD9|nr:peroxiredoxin family protein [Edaphobacter bradus]